MRWCFLAAAVAPHKYEFIRNGIGKLKQGKKRLFRKGLGTERLRGYIYFSSFLPCRLY